jgi:amino acid adenylation domain-containing protein
VTALPQSCRVGIAARKKLGEEDQRVALKDMSPTVGLDLPARLDTWADASPNSLALWSDDIRYSYGETRDRSAALATLLQARGVRRGEIVALSLNRGPSWVIAALAVLRAGAAYLPIDPAYPAGRQAFMLEDSGATIVLTETAAGPGFPAGDWTQLLLDECKLDDGLRTDVFRGAATAPTDLAYVIYTSGSTGTPKGVEVTHGGLMNLLDWHIKAFDVSSSDRAMQVSSPAFDATGWEIWPYLCAGASVNFPADEVRYSDLGLQQYLLSRDITIGFLPTVMAEAVLQLAWPERVSLRYLLTGGDRLQRFPSPDLPFVLVNNYGPTECTVVASSGVVSPAVEESGEFPSIGRAIDGVQTHVLDEHLEPVKADQTGELCVGGAGVARGYRNRPELTAERFIPDPFTTTEGAKLYRTGDLARLQPDGTLRFVGRLDDQVQIRGYRVELGEVEAALLRRPEVERAVVIAADAGAAKYLAAYVVLESECSVQPSDLVESLARILPHHMIPSAFIRMKSLPTTPEGKVDRQALPDPRGEGETWGSDFTRPASPTEEMLSSIVGSLLGLEVVGVDQNFFLLGGHSLFGAQLAARIADAFGVEISLLSIFESPTIAQLALTLEDALVSHLQDMSDEDVARLLG